MAMIGIAHVVMGFLLYAARIKNIATLFHSDLLVFLVPTLLAFAAYCFVEWPVTLPAFSLPVRLCSVAFIALIATAISFVLTLLVAFNTYGT